MDNVTRWRNGQDTDAEALHVAAEEVQQLRVELAKALSHTPLICCDERHAAKVQGLTAERDALKAAIDFLYARQVHDGSGVSFSAQRCRGRSSDALAWYGAGMRDEPHRDEYPLDGSDLAACERTLAMAPAHIAERMKPVIERYRAALDTPTPTEATARPIEDVTLPAPTPTEETP